MLSTLFPPYKALSTACSEDRFAELPSAALSSAGRRDTLHYYNTAVQCPSIVITPVHLMSADMYKLFDKVRNGEYDSSILREKSTFTGFKN